MRILLLVHRWLGIAGSALMVMWCASGIVMMYVPYPKVTEVERRRGLAPIAWEGCCAAPAEGPVSAPVAEALIERLGGRVVLRAPGAGVFDLRTGQGMARVDEQEARSAAASFAARARGAPDRAPVQLLGVVADDAWTVGGVPRSERPLYRFAVEDDAATQVYVSSVSGRVVQATTHRERFWSWLGAIPHWLYFAALRRHVGAWSGIVVYTSLAGCFLAITGLAAGIGQLVRATRRGRLRNPWGLLEGSGVREAQDRVRGASPSAARVVEAVRELALLPAGSDAVLVRMVLLEGGLYFVVDRSDGTRARFDELGRLAPLAPDDVWRIAQRLAARDPIESVELLAAEDSYYFAPPGFRATLPVWRVLVGDAQRTRYYLDTASGELLADVDRNVRGYRWLHEGLHRLDLWPALRRRPTWDLVVVPLLLGALGVCATGLYIGMRRVMGKRGRSPGELAWAASVDSRPSRR
jgi:hypothetical protein